MLPKPAVKTPSVDPGTSEIRYLDGIQLEREGRFKDAVQAYREAADAGNGHAQRKLGDIYGTGRDGVPVDYETSLRWYRRAREQGLAAPLPYSYSPVPRQDMSPAK